MGSVTQTSRAMNEIMRPMVGARITTGNVFFLDSGASGAADAAGKGLSKENPFATLDYAFSQCTASNGDIIYVMPGHAETDTGIGLDVAGVTVIGLGHGDARPTFTADTTAADMLAVTGADIKIENLRLLGAASGVTAIIDVGADNFWMDGCSIETGAAPVDIITISAGINGKITNNYFLGTAAGPDNVFEAEVKLDTWTITDNVFNYLEFDIDENIVDCAGVSCPGTVIARNQMLGLAVAACTIKSSVANKFGYFGQNMLVAHAAAVTISKLIGTTVEGLFFIENYGTDTTQTETGALMPRVTPL